MATVISGDTGVDRVTDGATMPAGSVLQIVESIAPLKSGIWTDNNEHTILSVTITPKSATSTLHITSNYSIQIYGNGNTANFHWSLKIYEGPSVIVNEPDLHDNYHANNTFHKCICQYIGGSLTSNSTNARTYHLKAKKDEANSYGRMNRANNYGLNRIVVTEVEG